MRAVLFLISFIAGKTFAQFDSVKNSIVYLTNGGASGSAVVLAKNAQGEALVVTANHNLGPQLTDRETGKTIEQTGFRLFGDKTHGRLTFSDRTFISAGKSAPSMMAGYFIDQLPDIAPAKRI